MSTPRADTLPTTNVQGVEQQTSHEGHDANEPSHGSLHSTTPKRDPEKPPSTYSSDGSNHDKPEAQPAEHTDTDLETQLPSNEDGEETDDPNIVFWDSLTDPSNPQNWSPAKKWSQIALVSLMSVLTPLASSGFAPGVPQLMQEFDSSSKTIATFVVSVYVLGFAFGPLIVAPLSELYGRLWVYHISNIGFIAFTIACSRAQGVGELCVYRFFEGVFGVTPITIGGGTIADLIKVEGRGAAMAIWSLGPLVGPVAGPVAGGFLSNAKGWRWMFYVIAMAAGAIEVPAFLLMKETYAPTLLKRKTKRLQKETGNQDLRSKLDLGQTPKEMFRLAIVRPMKLLCLSPICTLMCVYMAIIYGFLYLLFTTFTYVFTSDYGFSSSIVGLVYLGLGVGNFIGLAALGYSSDRLIKYFRAKNNGVMKPEYRLPPLIIAAPLIGTGLLIYGFTVKYHVFWFWPIFGTAWVGIGMIIAFMAVMTYLVDVYGVYAASAVAANTILRSIFGGVFPLFALQMYQGLGLDWGNALLAFLAFGISPIPVLFWRYGERIRTNPKFQVKL
ncbi:hypothetical protein CKM354_001253700 [Cercospora kikuchii]|uniref:Cercosporin MFS transporter CTB4 n=1 Tax=Cercospora kikuchii TaxID=84275 RepID=A0A9P3FM60_9PEZI|nr:uncharacterized protein CKM354_001253700 [Cercospora kikuchii]GIZ49507.1 hypothetical protein CKM354_001253700 [Cercospora kikuchii]